MLSDPKSSATASMTAGGGVIEELTGAEISSIITAEERGEK